MRVSSECNNAYCFKPLSSRSESQSTVSLSLKNHNRLNHTMTFHNMCSFRQTPGYQCSMSPSPYELRQRFSDAQPISGGFDDFSDYMPSSNCPYSSDVPRSLGPAGPMAAMGFPNGYDPETLLSASRGYVSEDEVRKYVLSIPGIAAVTDRHQERIYRSKLPIRISRYQHPTGSYNRR